MNVCSLLLVEDSFWNMVRFPGRFRIFLFVCSFVLVYRTSLIACTKSKQSFILFLVIDSKDGKISGFFFLLLFVFLNVAKIVIWYFNIS